jgi:replicative DNA helicase Mcm
LADKGIACIDEMDKMRSEDRSALHEAMEQQTISVAKAGVMATLKSRCALLAAANPKFGRFDKYEGIAQQINLSPALMSRFDLIFVLTDEPSDARDSKIAHHIGQTTYAGEISSRGGYSNEELQAIMDVIRPAIEPEVLRKYIAYARKNVFPVLSDEARERLESYYVSLRKQGQDSNKPVPVTARQLEALFRLSESSARLRLSDEITGGDAERVIRIVEACLRQVGVDPETGLLDADVLAVGMSKSTRDKTRMMIDLVKEVGSLHQGPAPLEVVLDRAEAELGMDRNKAEEIIKRLKRDGAIFEPRNGFLNLT